MMRIDPIELVVGTYADSGGEGLYPLGFDPLSERWSVGAPIAPVTNASFGLYASARARFYFVGEAQGTLGVYRGAADGWQAQAVVAAGGGAPCHFALHPSERWLALAHYASGSVAVFALDPHDGPPQGPVALHRMTGQGPDPHRQESPHAHWVGFDQAGAILHCVDLGTDRILAFAFDGANGTLGDPIVAYAAPAGSGPRHLLFHPTLPVAYLVSEMAATVSVLRRQSAGTFAAGRIVPTLVDGADGNIAGGIALNRAGDRLYVTTRGDDCVTTFALDPAGDPVLLDRISSRGRSPRFVYVADDQRRLLVAHEGGATMTAFTIVSDGRLSDPVPIAIPGAAFVMPARPIAPS
uniref:lactonase family protein n=1 Tax=uncultured Sphingomonas sp. TaxID=158754 RepID=UPI0035CA2D3D